MKIYKFDNDKFVRLSDIQDELNELKEYYADNVVISNFINSFYHGLEL